jgi:hypothetical protein
MRRAPAGTAAILAVALLVGSSCSSGSSTQQPPSRAELQQALGRGVGWSRAHLGDTDAFTLVVFDYLWRRFGIDELSSARSRAQRLTADARPADEPELRMIRPGARPSPASLREPASAAARLVRDALACDEPESPPELGTLLRAAVAHGGYELTHAAVVLQIEHDLGCPPTGGSELRGQITSALVAEVGHDRTVVDVSVERLAMLALLGAGARIPAARLHALLDAQQSDGGWPGSDLPTRAHTTALAIWVLADRTGLRGHQDAGLVLRG